MLHPTAVFNVTLVQILFAGAALVSVLLLIVAYYSTLRSHLHQRQQLLLSRPTVGTPAQTMDVNNTHASNYAVCIVQALVYAFIVLFFVAIRLGTLRIYSTVDPLNPTEVVYNHRETDERVFEVLLIL